MVNQYIFDNEDLAGLLEATPYPEGAGLLDFMEEAKNAAQAIKYAEVKLNGERCRVLYLMRALYLLGVFRGGETYRNILLSADTNEDWPDQQLFSLDDVLAELFADDLNSLAPQDLAQVWASLGL